MTAVAIDSEHAGSAARRRCRLLDLPTELSSLVLGYFNVNDPEFWNLYCACKTLRQLLLQRHTLLTHFHQYLSIPIDRRALTSPQWRNSIWRNGIAVFTVSVPQESMVNLCALSQLVSQCPRLQRLIIKLDTPVPSLKSLNYLYRAIEDHWPWGTPLKIAGDVDPFATGFAAKPIAMSFPSDEAREFARPVQIGAIVDAQKFQVARWKCKNMEIVLVASHALYSLEKQIYWKSTDPKQAFIRFRSDVATHTVTTAFLKRLGHARQPEVGQVITLHYPVNSTFRYIDCEVVEDNDQQLGWRHWLSASPGQLTIAWAPVQQGDRRDASWRCPQCSIARIIS